MWKGHLTFGLVSFPVRIHPALDASEHVGFRLLHRKDHAPITYKKYCSKEDVEVSGDEIVRAYERGGKYSVVEGAELEQVQEELGEGQHTIDVLQFVEPASLDPLLFERPYYVVPDEGGAKAYGLLRDALHEAGQVGVVRLYLRRPLLGALLPRGDVLALEAMRPFDELRPASRLAAPSARASEPEKRMARKLIEEMTAAWDPRAHPNRYRATLEKLLAGRSRFELGEAAGGEPTEARPGKVVDLMEALRRSLATKERGGASGGRRAPRAQRSARGAAASRTRKTSSAAADGRRRAT